MEITPNRTFTVKESMKLDDGAHTGAIVRLEYRDEPYQYLDFFIKLDGTEFELKYGVPQNLSMTSKLGRLMEVFGKKLVAGDEISSKDIEDIFLNKKVKFVTVTEIVKVDGQQREYSRIADGSLKLA